MYEYPYGNAQQLNLDWLLTAWREFQQQVENMVATQWSDTTEYTQNDLVIYDHVLYYCTVESATVGEFNPEEWKNTTVAEIVGN